MYLTYVLICVCVRVLQAAELTVPQLVERLRSQHTQAAILATLETCRVCCTNYDLRYVSG